MARVNTRTPPTMTVHVGLIGGGNITETHARALAEIPGAALAGVWGTDLSKCEGLTSRYGGRTYPSLAAMLEDPKLDAVVIGSPSGCHADQGLEAVRHGKHILVEKPLDIRTGPIDALLSAAEKAAVRVGVIYQDRTAPDLQWLKRVIEEGSLGRIFLASARVKWYRPPEYYAGSRWRGTFALDGGGAVINQSTHTLDQLLWLLGDVTRVYARTQTALHSIEVEDTAIACFDFVGGATATFEATTAAYPGYPRRIEVTGTGGTVIVEQDRVVSWNLQATPSEPPPAADGTTTASASSAVVSDIRSHRKVLENFVAAIRDGTPLLCDGHDGRRSVALVEAIYESSRTGGVIMLK